MAAFTAIEVTRITAELTVAFKQNCPATRAAFLDGTDTEANTKANVQTIVGTVVDSLFNQTAPVISP